MPRTLNQGSVDVLASKAPALSASDAKRIAGDVFGVHGAVRPLESERDQNFHLRSQDGREFVFKVANPSEDPTVVDFQTRALLHIAACDPALPVPRVLTTPGGEHSQTVAAPDGRRHIVRLLSYLPGRLLREVPHPPPLLHSVGASLARLGRSLRGFFHPAAGYQLLWDLKNAARLREHTHHIADAGLRDLANRFLGRFESRVLNRLPGLRSQVVHNDMGRNNTLVDAGCQAVAGIFDFGDMVHTALVNDVAVTLAEMVLDESDPVQTAIHVLEAYTAVEALREETISAWRVKDHAENRDYIAGEDHAYRTALERLAGMDPDFVHDRFREACGFAPLARTVVAPPAADRVASDGDG
jgi:Ser/Thr protein kinase RdoA (MazF antagonist)